MNEKQIDIQYRTWLHGVPPKRIKLDVGGWAGDNTWKIPQGWHCKPYADANTYGLDLIYPWKTTCTVSCDDKGVCHFEGDFTAEKPDYLSKDWSPFAAFAPFHFGYISMIDLKVPEGQNLMVLPHPRVFSCKDGSTPVAVPGQLEMDWWPEIFFIVFKAPLQNTKYVFKEGDSIAQFIVVPRNIKYNITPMDKEEATARAQRQHNLEKFWHRLCNRVYYSQKEDDFFDNKYKVLSAIAKKDGNETVEKIMDDPKLIPHWEQNPQVVDHRESKKVVHHAPWTEEELKKMNTNTEIDDDDFVNEQIDELLAKELTTDEITDAEIEKLVAAFKMQKRKQRNERTLKVKAQADPKKLIDNKMKANKKSGEFALGYKIEKLL
jgi:hypothetical protein